MPIDEITTTEFDSDHLPDDGLPPSVIQIYGGQIGRRFELGKRDLTIGRGSGNVIPLDLSTVSRHHARLFEREGHFYVEDLGSTNGSFVNGEKIEGIAEIRSGDIVKLGGAVFKFLEGGNTEALYYEEIYRLTIIDGLTQIPNKRYLLDFLEREMARARRHERPLYLAMIDVDHFKVVNDEFGHVVGDAVLRGLAQILQDNVRRDELAARYGGEEFAIVLPETDLEGAKSFADRLRSEIARHVFDLDGREIRVTISIGLAAFDPSQSAEQFIDTADRRLYRAKDRGRDRTIHDG